jgi:small subunit ribosomal protein S6
MGMRKYELMMIIDPTLSDADRKTLLAEVTDELSSKQAKILIDDQWGVKNLAYKIRSSATGYYVLYTLESEGQGFFEITKSFNMKKAIWRHMFVRLED